MSFADLVARRQSCRAYLNRPVERELIDRCLEAARLAPSACNSQPWRFIVIDREPVRTELAEQACTGLYSLNKFVLQAPVIVVVVTERSKYTARLGGQFRGIQYSLVDIGIAGEHFDLQAAELGLGTCWLGWFNEKRANKILGLPRSARIDIMFSMGYPERETIRPKKRLLLDEMRVYHTP